MAKSEISLIRVGFYNWKNGAKRIHDHSVSVAHQAAAQYVSLQSKTSVLAKVSTLVAKQQSAHRQSVIAELNSIVYLMRQGWL